MSLHAPLVLPALAVLVQEAVRNPLFYLSWVGTVIVGVVLHELGHGVTAISQGDDTPRTSGHLTLNPLVHMGGFSLLALFVVGIAWGQTPVNPARFRHRYSDALVSAAGPAVNLLLALLGLTVLGLMQRAGQLPQIQEPVHIWRHPLGIFGGVNLVLLLLNLIPVPPLDGSRVVASFVPEYKRWSTNPANQGVFMALFLVVFFAARYLFEGAENMADAWLTLLRGW